MILLAREFIKSFGAGSNDLRHRGIQELPVRVISGRNRPVTTASALPQQADIELRPCSLRVP